MKKSSTRVTDIIVTVLEFLYFGIKIIFSMVVPIAILVGGIFFAIYVQVWVGVIIAFIGFLLCWLVILNIKAIYGWLK